MLTGCGSGEFTGRAAMDVVRWARESRRWLSDLDERRERWCWKTLFEVGAATWRDCWFRTMAKGESVCGCKENRVARTFRSKACVREVLRFGSGLSDLELGFLEQVSGIGGR